ncbi:MAG: thiamine phosphate synthase [Parvibaculales bacterium]
MAKAKPAPPRPQTRLYLITPPQIELTPFADTLAEALNAGDVACLQLRLKATDGTPAPEAEIAAALDRLMPIAHAHDVALLLNDDPTLAQKYGCDGVHIGQNDMPYAQARQVMGDDAIIGVTCHDSKHLAMEAGEAGADYVAFGAFYDTPTKDAKSRATPELLTFWQEFVELPCVAIGGITPDNAAPLVEAGADFIATSSAVWQHADGPTAAIARFNALFAACHAK